MSIKGASKFTPLSRRSFIKSSAALGAAAVLAGCSKNDNETIFIDNGGGTVVPRDEEKLIPSVCRPNCFSACYLNAHVRNNRLVKTSRRNLPDPSYNRICLRGLSHVQRMYSPTRLTQPLIRRTGTPRGGGDWVTASWEEAITYICDRFKHVRNNFTNESVVQMSGSSNYATVQKAVMSRFFNVMGMASISPQLDFCEAAGFARVMGYQTTFPFNQSNEAADFRNAKTIIAWGANPVEAQLHNWHFIADAIDNGATLVSVDVMLSGTAARSHKVVHLTPGTDTLLALSMIQLIIEKGYEDREFMNKNTVAPFLIDTATGKFLRFGDIDTLDASSWVSNAGDPEVTAASFLAYDSGTGQLIATVSRAGYLSGKHVFTDGTNVIYPSTLELEEYHAVNNPSGVPATVGSTTVYTVKTAFQLLKDHVNADYKPADTEAKTGVKVEVVEDLVELYANNGGPSTLIAGYAPDHYSNGHHTYHAIATLAAITGNIGKKGASVGSFVGLGGGAITGGNISSVAGYSAGRSITYNAMVDVFNPASANNLPTVDGNGGPNEIFDGVSLKQRALYVAWGNPVNTFTNTQRLKEMFLERDTQNEPHFDSNDINYKLQLIALADYEITDTAEYADVILPLAHWFEQKDICSASNHPYMTYQDVAVAPLGECKSDSEIATLMAREMGFGELFTYSIDEYIDRIFDRDAYNTWYTNMTGKTAPEDRIPTLGRLKAEDSIRVFPGSMSDPYIYPAKRTPLSAAYGHTCDDLSIGTSIGFSSGTGRLEFYTEFIWIFSYYGQNASVFPIIPGVFETRQLIAGPGVDMATEYIPTHEDPIRSVPGNPDYPLQMMSERPRWRVHSQWHNTEWIREFDPYPIIKINPADAANIRTGDLVRIENYNGHCYARAVLNPGIRKGTVNIPRGWHEKQFQEHFGEFVLAKDNGDAGGSQRLTTDEVHPATAGQSFYDVIVKIEKVEG